MKTASVADVKAHFNDYVKASERGPVIVTRNGKPVVILLGVDDEGEIERMMMARSPQLQAMLNAARERIRAGKGIPEDEFWKDVERSSKAKPRRRKARKKVG
jgi:prevent-host-death family protein